MGFCLYEASTLRQRNITNLFFICLNFRDLTKLSRQPEIDPVVQGGLGFVICLGCALGSTRPDNGKKVTVCFLIGQIRHNTNWRASLSSANEDAIIIFPFSFQLWECTYEGMYPQRLKASDSSGTGVMGDSKPPDTGAGT